MGASATSMNRQHHSGEAGRLRKDGHDHIRVTIRTQVGSRTIATSTSCCSPAHAHSISIAIEIAAAATSNVAASSVGEFVQTSAPLAFLIITRRWQGKAELTSSEQPK